MANDSRNDSRIESDSLGKVEVPATALYGAQTQRAAENFPVSGLRLPRRVIRALALIKKAAAEVNRDSGKLEPKLAEAIIKAAHEVAGGAHDDAFVVDIFQTGSGTSSNMNTNEVIANRAIQILGGADRDQEAGPPQRPRQHGAVVQRRLPDRRSHRRRRGDGARPGPGAGGAGGGAGRQGARLRPRGQDRPHPLDGRGAGPPGAGVRRLRADADQHRAAGEGGGARRSPSWRWAAPPSARGSSAAPEFAPKVIRIIAEEIRIPLRQAPNLFEALSMRDGLVEASGAMRSAAVSLTKVANDVRWLGSGPRCGIGEITLPDLQPGSSIMPGKVNPVMSEMLLMICAQVVGQRRHDRLGGAAGTSS